jgi:hypothetical protein
MQHVKGKSVGGGFLLVLPGGLAILYPSSLIAHGVGPGVIKPRTLLPVYPPDLYHITYTHPSIG